MSPQCAKRIIRLLGWGLGDFIAELNRVGGTTYKHGDVWNGSAASAACGSARRSSLCRDKRGESQSYWLRACGARNRIPRTSAIPCPPP
jgi:hypothetical protein